MRFPSAWADIAAQNVTLRGVIFILSVTCVVFATLAAKFGLRDPLIIERGCMTRVATPGPVKVSEEEIKAFVKEAVASRFNTDGDFHPGLLSMAQAKARSTEQDDLKKKGIRQTVIVNAVTAHGDSIRVDADRVVAIDKIRSAFPFELDVSIATTERSFDDPYGLVLTKIMPTVKKESGK